MTRAIIHALFVFAFAGFFVTCSTSAQSEFHRQSTVYKERQIFFDKNATFARDQFLDIASSDDGGAIYFTSETNHLLLLQTTTFMNCSTTFNYGGAIFTRENSTCEIKASTFLSCSTDFAGGGVSCFGPSLLTETKFRDCNSMLGGSADLSAESFGVVVSACDFENGNCVRNAGAIYCDSPLKGFKINNCSFAGNKAALGGALFFQDFSTEYQRTTFTNCRFANNIATNSTDGGNDIQFRNYEPTIMNHTCFVRCASTSASPLIYAMEKGDVSSWMYGRPVSSDTTTTTTPTPTTTHEVDGDEESAAEVATITATTTVPVKVIVGAVVGVVGVVALVSVAFIAIYRSFFLSRKQEGYTPL